MTPVNLQLKKKTNSLIALSFSTVVYSRLMKHHAPVVYKMSHRFEYAQNNKIANIVYFHQRPDFLSVRFSHSSPGGGTGMCQSPVAHCKMRTWVLCAFSDVRNEKVFLAPPIFKSNKLYFQSANSIQQFTVRARHDRVVKPLSNPNFL